MKTFIAFLLGLAMFIIGATTGVAGLSAIGMFLLLTSLVIGLFKAHKASEREQHNRDVQKMKKAGGTNAEALMYASLEQQRRNAWIQTAAQMKK